MLLDTIVCKSAKQRVECILTLTIFCERPRACHNHARGSWSAYAHALACILVASQLCSPCSQGIGSNSNKESKT